MNVLQMKILREPKVQEQLSYQLQSVVSHHGLTASAGHYVADVFRYDLGGWLRYDDQRVSSTSLEVVTSGSNIYNGYILTYCHSPLWRRLRNSRVRNGFI